MIFFGEIPNSLPTGRQANTKFQISTNVQNPSFHLLEFGIYLVG
jgi:hypothetical protein